MTNRLVLGPSTLTNPPHTSSSIPTFIYGPMRNDASA